MAQTKAQRSEAAKKAAATRKRNATKKTAKEGEQETRASARSTGRSVAEAAKAVRGTAKKAATSAAKTRKPQADAARPPARRSQSGSSHATTTVSCGVPSSVVRRARTRVPPGSPPVGQDCVVAPGQPAPHDAARTQRRQMGKPSQSRV